MSFYDGLFYAGIGSRETPDEIIELMKQIATHLARKGYTLRSGGAGGADKAFEDGCDKVNGKKEIFLPWPNFENSKSSLVVTNKQAAEIAEKYHPYWENLSQGARKLQARNSCQVLGHNLDSPSRFIICYTKGGKGKGGTGQAIRIARSHNIPIFDCGLYENNLELLKNKFREFIKEQEGKE